MLNWQYFPRNKILPTHLEQLVSRFETSHSNFSSDYFNYSSDEVLNIIAADLIDLGYNVERSKKELDLVKVPVLYGRDGTIMKGFNADGVNPLEKTVIEIEAGRAVTNYQFLKDLFQACMMIDVSYLVIAVRNIYRDNKDFDKVVLFFETLYMSGRLKLPLEGVLVIGY